MLDNGNVVFYVKIKNHVMVVDRAAVENDNSAIDEIVMSALDTTRSGELVQMGTLMHYHEIFEQFSYNTIERLARMPESGIQLTNHIEQCCLTCVEEHQARATQPKQDTGESAHMDRVGRGSDM